MQSSRLQPDARWPERSRNAPARSAPESEDAPAQNLRGVVASGGVSNALLQRWEWPEWLGGEGEGTPGEPKEKDEPPLPEFTYGRFVGGKEGFRADYVPVGPAPDVGQLTITMRVTIDFQDFARDVEDADGKKPYRGVRLTPAQRADRSWTPDERIEFANNFRASIEQAWSAQHDFALQEEGFAEYLAALCVVVEIVPPGERAHHSVTAHKIPEGLTFRSFYSSSENEVVVADEDVDVGTDHVENEPEMLAQVGPFDHDSADLNAGLETQVDALADRLKPLQRDATPGDRRSLLSERHWADFVGRATESGSRSYNQKVGKRRAETVEGALADRLGRTGADGLGRTGSVGEENANDDPKFRRVDMKVVDFQEVMEQPPLRANRTTAAHEAGHMFGLGDEYEEEDEDTGRFEGDRPTHYDDVKRLMGEEAAERTLVNDDESIMSEGSNVHAGHYVYFLEVLNEVTEKSWSVVDASGGGACAPTPRHGAADRELPDGSRPEP